LGLPTTATTGTRVCVESADAPSDMPHPPCHRDDLVDHLVQ